MKKQEIEKAVEILVDEEVDDGIEIEQNLLRPRAKRLPTVTDEMWEKVNPEYRELAEEFVQVNSYSPQTKKQYISGLRQFGFFVKESMNNKPLYKVSKRDFLRYMTYLRDDRQMSSSAQNFKKAVISSLCNYVENMVVGDDPEYANFRNFTRGLPAIPKNRVYDKKVVTFEEYEYMMDLLEKDENYLGRAWLSTAFLVGSRRAEIVQFKTDILSYDSGDGDYVDSHTVRGKGSSIDGKDIKFMIPNVVREHWQKWVDHRGYEHESIFTTTYDGETTQMKPEWGNYFCDNVLTNMLGRRINPHIFKNSAITYYLEQGVPMNVVSEFIAHHEGVETTQIYDLREFEEERRDIFKSLR